MRSVAYKFSIVGLLITVGIIVAALPSRAARDLTADPATTSEYELVVLEVSRCIYCKLFRRDVVPTYNATTHAKSVPMRFVDIDHGSLSAFHLTAPIEIVPTIVLLHQSREVGRVAGHIGPESFLHALNRLLSEAP